MCVNAVYSMHVRLCSIETDDNLLPETVPTMPNERNETSLTSAGRGTATRKKGTNNNNRIRTYMVRHSAVVTATAVCICFSKNVNLDEDGYMAGR